MEPPSYVCEALERISPWARIAWNGENKCFSVIDLYPAKLAKHTYREKWGNRGTIYGSDFDRLSRIPIWIEDVPAVDVHGGRVIARVKRMASSLKDRVKESWVQRQNERKSDIKDLAGKQGEYLYWQAKTNPHRGHVIANKFIAKEDRARAAGDWVSRIDQEKPPQVNPIGMT